MHTDILLSMPVLNTHALSTTQASRIAVHPLAGAEVAHVHTLLATGILTIVCLLLSRPGFSWLLPRSFPLWIYVTVVVSFPHGRICGSCVVVSLTYKLGEL